mgnify:CR=1 FL=1
MRLISKILMCFLFASITLSSPIFGVLSFVDLLDITWNDTKGYNPFGSAQVTYKVQFSVLNSSNQTVDYFVTISKGTNNDPAYDRWAYYSTEHLQYQI